MVAAEHEEEAKTAPPTGPGRPVGKAGESEENIPVDSDKAKATKLAIVQSCLEDLLSKQNLAEDAFIQQNMNAQMYIPLCILAGHHRIGKLGRSVDVGALLEAASRSDKLGVDEEQLLVRPLLKARRNTLILHDLPEDVVEQELQELFQGSPEGDSFCSVKPDVNRTAFVSFQTDEAAQRAALWLRSQTLHGSSVKCAVKAEHVLRSFYPAAPGTPPVGMSMPPYCIPGQQAVWAQGTPWAGQWQAAGAGATYGNAMEMWGDGAGGCETGAWAQGDGMAKGGMHFQEGGVKGYGKGKGKGKGKGRRKGEGLMPPGAEGEMGQMEAFAAQRTQKSPVMRMRADSFVPIQEPLEPAVDDTVVDDSELGYTHDFRKYSREEIIEVCSGMDDIAKPESFIRFEKEEKDVTLFRQSPYKDWAPLPTPQITFALNAVAGEGRRSTSDGSVPNSPLVEGLGRPPRKGSAMSRTSWSSSRRSRSTSRGRLESGEQTEEWSGGAAAWDGAEWEEWGGDASWSKGSEAARWRRRGSSWSDWYGSGQQWVEKPPAESWGPRRTSWAEKVRGTRERSASVGAPQRWKAKSKAEGTEEGEPETERAQGAKEQGGDAKEEGKPATEEQPAAKERGGDAKGAEVVAEDPAPRAETVQGAGDSKGATQVATAEAAPANAAAAPTEQPAAAAVPAPAAAAEPAPAPDPKPRAQTWADRVRLGGSAKAAPKPMSG
mmetsp:Transcript_102444/g.320292  ORF Transcript_102444/g.320292 Transcript_102444/m.320292 type:complete len:717 (+) Transcript_102444:162-2312(+)